jgi:glycerophosphoryl diester phosphodiesterase
VRARFGYLRHPGPLAIAHRGGAAERPENTWAAFSHARELGYHWMETDVHATADGVVAVIHDPHLERVADRPGVVAQMRWAEVAAADLGDGQRVPRLDELLAAWPDTRWNIDAKHDAVVEPLVEVLRRANAVERVCVTSFSDRRTARARRLAGPALCTATGPQAIAALRVASLAPATAPLQRLPAAPWSGAGAAQVPVAWAGVPVVDRRFVAAAHRVGLAVHVWTIDDEAEMDRLLDLDVDGIMTDRPQALRSVLERRSQWH